jgi:type III secretion protein R
MAKAKLIHFRYLPLRVAIFFSFFSTHSYAKGQIPDLGNNILSDPFYLLFFIVGISLLPFIAIMVTSFAKIVVVLSITRQAIGTPQVPPNIVIISLSMILTIFSMYPVIREIEKSVDGFSWHERNNSVALKQFVEISKEPIRRYLFAHAHVKDRQLFLSLLKKENSADHSIGEEDFVVLAPAFLISELSHAFQIGFLIYLPFLVIDMVVANLLMALGMQMLSPTTISLPFKLLLFVLVDGWRLLAEGLAKV